MESELTNFAILLLLVLLTNLLTFYLGTWLFQLFKKYIKCSICGKAKLLKLMKKKCNAPELRFTETGEVICTLDMLYIEIKETFPKLSKEEAMQKSVGLHERFNRNYEHQPYNLAARRAPRNGMQ